jgi:glycosyltransferase involved in cell wall biosynthesis
MHICILADPIDDQRAGVHTYTKHIIEELLKIDRQNHYSFIHKRENSFFDDLQEQYPNQVKHHIVPPRKHPLSGTYRKFIAIPKTLRQIKPDITFEPCHIGPFCTPKNSKRVLMIHDLTPITLPQHHITRSVVIHKLFLKPAIQKADLILTASQNTANDIKKRYKTRAKIITIPLGINHPPQILPEDPKLIQILKTGTPPQHLEKHKTTSPAQTNIPQTPPPRLIKSPYLLYLGTIEPRKNLKTLIDAFAQLKTQKQIPHQLILAGELGWKSKKILKKIANTNQELATHQVQLLGFVDEETKSNLYKHADVFIYPSLYEGFGLPPLEAMAHKTPVIIANNSSLQEYFAPYALTFDEKSPKPQAAQELAKQISTLLQNPKTRQDLINKAHRYSQEFSWEKAAKETLEALIDLS